MVSPWLACISAHPPSSPCYFLLRFPSWLGCVPVPFTAGQGRPGPPGPPAPAGALGTRGATAAGSGGRVRASGAHLGGALRPDISLAHASACRRPARCCPSRARSPGCRAQPGGSSPASCSGPLRRGLVLRAKTNA